MKKLVFLFWNIGKNDVRKQLLNLAEQNKVDIILLAECTLSDEELLASGLGETFVLIPDSNAKIKILTRLETSGFWLISNEPRYTIKHLSFEGLEEFLLVGLHFPSKLNMESNQQTAEAVILNSILKAVENDLGIDKTIVVGDFNMHPFEYGMVSHAAFNAVMTREIAKIGSRKVQFRQYPYFYNPMWSFLGDLSKGIAGTHFYNDDYHWHLYDQVLVRPALIDNFIVEELEILTGDGTNNFLNEKGRINRSFSDHLPIKFSLDF